METQQNGKTALITGAASGIGLELARLFAKDGYALVLVDRDEEGLNQVAYNLKNQYGTPATLLTKDLADPKAPDEIYAETSRQHLHIDVLVNDAGFGEYGQFATETDLQKELAMVQTNAVALMHLTKLYLKDMVIRNDGKILLLGSEVSVAPNPLQAVYGATKAFIKSFGEAIRDELKASGAKITVTVLMPGATSTNFFRTAGAAHVKGADPSKTASPADVAKAGYEALMSGKDHVVAGFKNKLTVALAHILPDPLIAANVRSEMTPKEEVEKQKQAITVALTVGAVVIGGLWLLSRTRNGYGISTYDKVKYRYKAGKAKHSAENALSSVADSVTGAYHHAKATVEKALV
ncbi:SDR family NAD(P)-dependent oxidoreductase [Spirosoma soli]|uniref:SDR family NAD(P)-dependent oxidoreductase n=1 Tax=Spirosoma soli TaxID=1770529 RepID=A0ABW5M6V9_9BACT